jgi:hypothetical protein
VRSGRLVFAALVIAAAGCASVIGIEDTVDEPRVPSGSDGSVDTGTSVDEDGSSQEDDGSSSTEVPVVDDDASTLADVGTIDAQVTTCAETGLVARWKIDEGAGTVVTDCSGNALHGVVTNGTWTSNGADGGALKFNGNGWVGFASPALLKLTGAFTVSLWLRADRTVSDTEYVFGKTTDPAKNGYRLGIISPQQLALATPSSATNFNVVGGSMPVGTWRHVAAVYRPSSATELYVNGAKVGNHSGAPAALVASNAEARLAARVDGKYGLSGAISDVRVYSRALGAAEITALSKR